MRGLLRELARPVPLRSLVDWDRRVPPPEWLHGPTDAPGQQIAVAAVGVQLTGPAQAHAAILYDDGRGEFFAIHFCAMREWKNEPLSAAEPFLWVPAPMDPIELPHFAELCALVAESRTMDEVPFAFQYDKANVFDRTTGKLFLGPSGYGLTCATFVLTMLASVGVRPIALKTWPNRPCDAPWQRRTLALLERAHGEHEMLTQAAEIGALRFRPEEVAASCSYSTASYPVDFQSVLSRGRDVLQVLGARHVACWYDKDCALDEVNG